jgi:CheY-like chemotaxis protein
MNREDIYLLLRSAVEDIRKEDDEIESLPLELSEEDKLLSSYNFDISSLGQLQRLIESRLDGRNLNFECFMIPENFYKFTIKNILDEISNVTAPVQKNPIVVYVDDEEENLFIFKRKFSKDLNIKTFTNPAEALAFIVSNQDVALVITDEVMPGLKGNQLCDEVHKVKPFMKFILITGNPENDSDLMYNTLRKNRFFEFFQKPVDFDKKREEYLNMIKGIIGKK